MAIMVVVMEDMVAAMEDMVAVMEDIVAVMEDMVAVMEDMVAVMEDMVAAMEDTEAVMEAMVGDTGDTARDTTKNCNKLYQITIVYVLLAMFKRSVAVTNDQCITRILTDAQTGM